MNSVTAVLGAVMAIALLIAEHTYFRNHWMKQTRLKVREALQRFHRGLLTVAVLPCGANVLKIDGGAVDTPFATDDSEGSNPLKGCNNVFVCLKGCPKARLCPILNRLLTPGEGTLKRSDGARKVNARVFADDGTPAFILDDYGELEELPLVDAVKFSTDGHTTVVAQLPPRNNSQDTPDDPDGVAEEPGNPLGNVETATHAANSTTNF